MKLLNAFFQDADKRAAISWAFFDFANSSYTVLILSFVFPIYFKEVIVSSENGDFYWGLIVSVSILMGGLLSPIIGAMADYDGRKKNKFITFTLVAVLGTALLYFTGSHTLLLASLIFIASNTALELAQTLYDSFLSHVSTKATVGRISGLAWGFGYIGGVASLLIFKPLFENGYAGDFASDYRLTFPLTALFFLLFSIPSFIFMKERAESRGRESMPTLVRYGVRRVMETIKNLKQHKNIAWFLCGFFFLNDALVTIFAFMPIYARTTFGMEFKEIIPLVLIVQILGFPAATFFGWLSDKKGSKKILLCTIACWALIVGLLSVAGSQAMFSVCAILTALVVGSSQAVARSWLRKLVPDDRQAEFFGFNGFASKIAATVGPVLFGIISASTGNQRIAVAALIPFFLVAFLIFTKIKEERTDTLISI